MNIREYYALSREGKDWTEAFRAAIDALRQQGGGVLTVPAGDYPTGSIRLYDNMTLDVQSGATIRFHQDPDAFPLVDLEFEGKASLMHQACIFAQHAKNVIVTGFGTIDGQGEYWWERMRKHTLTHNRPYLICFVDCERVVIENVTLTNSPVWTVHPLRCKHVTCRGLMVKNPYEGPNTDGINPDSCTDVRILDCTIDVGDDCVTIKSGTEETPELSPCERIIIEGCHFVHGHGGVVLGSEMSGNIRNVVVGNCIFHQTDRGIRLKTRRGRGGVVEGVQLFNLVMEKVMCPFVFNMYYGPQDPEGKFPVINDKNPRPVDKGTPVLRDVAITGVRARKCGAAAAFFYGLPEMPVEGVTMNDVVVEMDPDGTPDYPGMMDGLPLMKGEGIFMRNARGVDLRGVRVEGVQGKVFNVDDSVELVK